MREWRNGEMVELWGGRWGGSPFERFGAGSAITQSSETEPGIPPFRHRAIPPFRHFSYFVEQCSEIGTTLSQAMLWSMPEVIGPQAVAWAARLASFSFSWEAVAQLRRPWNSTHTLQLTFWALRVLNSSRAPKITMARMVMTVPRFMGGGSPERVKVALTLG